MSCLIYNLQGFIHFSNSQRIVLYCHHNACLLNAWVSKTISSKDTQWNSSYMIDIRQVSTLYENTFSTCIHSFIHHIPIYIWHGTCSLDHFYYLHFMQVSKTSQSRKSMSIDAKNFIKNSKVWITFLAFYKLACTWKERYICSPYKSIFHMEKSSLFLYNIHVMYLRKYQINLKMESLEAKKSI